MKATGAWHLGSSNLPPGVLSFVLFSKTLFESQFSAPAGVKQIRAAHLMKPGAGCRIRTVPRLTRAVDRGGYPHGGGDRGEGDPLPAKGEPRDPPHPARPFGAPPSPPGRGQCVAMVTGKTCPRSRPFSGYDDCPQTNQQCLKSPFVSGMGRYSHKSPYLTLVRMGSPLPPYRLAPSAHRYVGEPGEQADFNGVASRHARGACKTLFSKEHL